MKLIIACEDTGAIKVINAVHGTDTSKPSTDDAPQTPVTITTHASENNTRKNKILQLVQSKKSGNIIATRLNGSVEVYDISKILKEEQQLNKETKKNDDDNNNNNNNNNDDDKSLVDLLPLIHEHKDIIPELTEKEGESFISALIDDNDRLIVTTNKGSVFIWSSEDEITQDPIKFILPLNENESIESFQIHPGKDNINYVAYGGKETDLRIVKLPSDINGKPEIVFKAKNVSNSRLELRVPIHIKKILFDKSSTPENFKLYTFTLWGDMRIYESKLGRKPRSSILVLPKKAPIINSIWLGNEFVVCDNTGIVVKVNPESGSQISKFKGQIGTTQALNNFNNSILATTGSDRYIRAYDNQTRECIVKVFVGTQSNAILIIQDNESLNNDGKRGKKISISGKYENNNSIDSKTEQENEKEESSDEEELWNKLESNITQRRKRRKITLV
ncbi:Ribosome biogenesis protein nsa1 (NOP7-associated protein 1) [Pichia californica]|uniref:Ribosome biogenesis protein NSA1 n=1 Tax=Pichia californica TaxID=460514 RepID=A0A9P7BIL5_9ASCO|nr:Ribosome biogenesis protein nsa1 (NOP7-associated protein 1) [[Candida] californica]KAG0691383.1 Ribosome biogenesis protein nsa1 (NOP7-associated protein 1) [[Candida] californica]